MADMIAEEVTREFQQCAQYRKKVWDGLDKKASEYVKGNQWTEQEKREMEAKKRVPAVFNMILPAIDLIQGNWLQSKMDLVAKPVDEFGDAEIASIITACIKYIEHQNMMQMQDKYQFRSGIIRGIGVKELWFDREKSLKGEIRCQYKKASDYFIDPDTTQYDLSDCSRIFKTVWMNKNELIRVYGKKKAEEAWGRYNYFSSANAYDLLNTVTTPQTWAGQSDDYGNNSPGGSKMVGDDRDAFEYVLGQGYDVKKKLCRVVERYEKVYEEAEYVTDPTTGEMVSIETYPPEVRPFLANGSIKRTEHHLHLTSIIGDSTVGEDADLDASEFNQLFNFFFPYWDDGKYMGVVENLFYPQDEINQRHASLVHVISTLAARGFLYEEDAITEDQESDLEDKLKTPGYVLKLEKDGLQRVKFQENLQVPTIFENLMEREGYNIKYISGANDAIQGISPRIQSGSAKATEIAQSAVRLMAVNDNWKDTKILCARALLWWIQTYYKEDRVIRIMSPEHMDQEDSIEINKPALGSIFNDITVGEYDVVWDWEGMTKSERERIMFRLTDLANTVPAYAQPIADEVIAMSDLPNKWKLLQKFQEVQQQQQQGMIPPQDNGIPGSPGGARRMPQQLTG